MLAKFLVGTLQKTAETAKSESVDAGRLMASIARFPAVALALYVAAPLVLSSLIVTRIRSKSTVGLAQSAFALLGFIVASIVVWALGAWLTTFAGFMTIWNNVGIVTAFSFLLGIGFSAYLSIFLQVMLFNAICFVFLGLTRESVVEQLMRYSQGE